MPVTIVAVLEMIHVHHRDGIVPPQPVEALLKGPTAGYTREFIQVGPSPGQFVEATQKEEGTEGRENRARGATDGLGPPRLPLRGSEPQRDQGPCPRKPQARLLRKGQEPEGQKSQKDGEAFHPTRDHGEMGRPERGRPLVPGPDEGA